MGAGRGICSARREGPLACLLQNPKMEGRSNSRRAMQHGKRKEKKWRAIGAQIAMFYRMFVLAIRNRGRAIYI